MYRKGRIASIFRAEKTVLCVTECNAEIHGEWSDFNQMTF